MRTKPNAHWQQRFTEYGVMHSVANQSLDVLNDPHVQATGLFSYLEQPGMDMKMPIPNIPGAPRLESGENVGSPPDPLGLRSVGFRHLLSNQRVDRGGVKTGFGKNFAGLLAQPRREPASRRLGFRPCARLPHGPDPAFRGVVLPFEQFSIGPRRIIHLRFQRMRAHAGDVVGTKQVQPFLGRAAF